MWNLLSNALKFTPAGGRVTVSLRFERKQVLLTVTDTGGGIPVERMETVFDGYLHPERLAALPCGLGLGLPLCRRIAEGHGGRMVLDSRPDQGTSVTLALRTRWRQTPWRTCSSTMRAAFSRRWWGWRMLCPIRRFCRSTPTTESICPPNGDILLRRS